LDDSFLYESDLQGATVQVSAHAVLEEPHRVALQLVLVPRGQQPYHRETVGDRRIEEGDPDIWIVLARFGDEPTERLVANRDGRAPGRAALNIAERLLPPDARTGGRVIRSVIDLSRGR